MALEVHHHYLMQFQSDILNVDIKRPKVSETTALGAFYLAGLSTGYFKNIEEIKKIHQYQDFYHPNMNEETRRNKYRKWKKAVKAARTF